MNKIIHGDSFLHLQDLENESVDLIITSPPYKDEDGYTRQLIYDVFNECWRVLRRNSLCFVNFGHLQEDKFRPFDVCKNITCVGFCLKDTIIWKKNHFKPIQGKKCLNNLTEFIFMMYKGEMPDLDRLSIGVPYKDKSNAKRFNNGLNLRCRGNLWEINYPTINKSAEKLHKDMFPVELPLNCIKLSGIKMGSVVLDPFSGSGTTLVAAKQLGMQYIGIEKNIEHIKTTEKRLTL